MTELTQQILKENEQSRNDIIETVIWHPRCVPQLSRQFQNRSVHAFIVREQADEQNTSNILSSLESSYKKDSLHENSSTCNKFYQKQKKWEINRVSPLKLQEGNQLSVFVTVKLHSLARNNITLVKVWSITWLRTHNQDPKLLSEGCYFVIQI